MSEHGHGGEEHHGFHGNPVMTGLTLADLAHLAGEGGVSGGLEVAEAGAHIAHEAGQVFEGATMANGLPIATAAQRTMFGATAIASPLAIAGGAAEIIDGVSQIAHGNAQKGAVTTTTGAATAGSGIAGLAGLAGSAGGAAAAGPLSAFALGMKVGAFGNENVKERGWLHDREGNDASASEWAAEKGQAVDEWVTEHSFGPLGTLAGLATTYGASFLGAGASLGAAGLSLGEALVADVGIADILEQQTHGSGDPLAAFHAGVANGSNDPLLGFRQGIANGSHAAQTRR